VKKWSVYPEREEALRLSQALSLSPVLSKILTNRGISSPDEAQSFLNPRLNNLRDPFEIPQIELAARRVLVARERGEKVLVYGDYDVDGVTGTAILLHTLKFLGIDATYYIPHRYREGYGLSVEAVREIAALGVKLILTVDCGISSVREIDAANALGMEVIVTDHHNLPAALPRASALVNPKQISGEHPSKNLSGAGVAFKFAWALLRTAGLKDNFFLTSLLDLVCLGTLSDVVSLTAENRSLVVGGLNLINERKRLGIKLLAEVASLYGKISVKQIYFSLAPRLNAAGRLEHASKSLELLLSEDPLRARDGAQELNRINVQRQELGSVIKNEVFARIGNSFAVENKIVLLSGERWHPGVVGIVASQVAEVFYRPTVLIGINDGVGRGSARSVNGFNIYELLHNCRDLFLDFGGHARAAGFEIAPENIVALKRRLTEQVEQMLKPEDLVSKIQIDVEIKAEQITLRLIKELERLAPFGEGNPAPVFALRNLQLTDFKTVGSAGKHLKAWFQQEEINLEAIGFGLGRMAGENSPRLVAGNNYDLAVNLESNEFNGFERAQLSLVDIREGGRRGEG
jgi:single-stranded-DNA-specific exonuclease